MSERLSPCTWCGRDGNASGWEQRNLRDEWKPLCRRCANRRLDNPWNAILGMRKTQEATS